jgi:hypothetical protein
MSTRFVLVLALGACAPKAQDVAATFALSPDMPAGNVQVVLSNPSRAFSVVVNDQLVVDRKLSQKATIGGVPAGVARVHVSIGGGCETGATFDRDVEVYPGATTSLTLPGPELSTGCALWHGLYYVGVNVGIAAVSIAMIAGAMAPHAHHK